MQLGRASRVGVATIGLLLGTVGCRKTISDDYVQAAQLFDALRSKAGAEAALDPRMAQVEALLRKVPERSLSHPSAVALQKRIDDERTALVQAREARDRSVQEALKPPDVHFAPSLPKSIPVKALPPESAPDAGAAQPVEGMAVSEFSQRFSGCFAPDAPLDVLGKGKLETWALKNIANCRDRHPGFDDRLVVVEKGKILAMVDRAAARSRSIPDGGAAQPR
jgi:hypothetical protein